MKRLKIEFTLFFIIISLTVSSQIMVVTADKGPAVNGDGLYYSLPATAFKVEVDLKRTESFPGPLADYCENYLGTSDYLKASSVTYLAIDVTAHPVTITDEQSSYYMVFSEKLSKEDKPPAVELTPLGTLLSVNMVSRDKKVEDRSSTIEENKTIVVGDDESNFEYDAAFNRMKDTDTVIRKITIDTMTINKFLFKTSWVSKTKEERAEEAAHQVQLIRESRMNLLTGYHEVNFGESLKYMDGQLKEMEQQYLELFQGTKQISVEHYTFFVIPDADHLQKQLLMTDSGDKLVLKIETIDKSPIKPMDATLNNIVYYRIPAFATVVINFNGTNLFKDIFAVNQLGTITGVSVYKAGINFDPASGVPLKIIKY